MHFARRIDSPMPRINDRAVNVEANTAFRREKASRVGRFHADSAIDAFTVSPWISPQATHHPYPL